MKIRRGISDAAAEVRETASKIGESAEWNTVALVLVAGVSLVALTVALVVATNLARHTR